MKTVFEYSEKNILVIPQSFYALEDVVPILNNGNSGIFYKNLEHDLVDVEFYTNAPCFVYIESGQETITTFENKTHELYANTAIFLPQGINLHSDYVKTTSNLKAYLVFFEDEVITDFLSTVKKVNENKENKTDLLKIKCDDLIKAYFHSIKLLKQHNHNSAELVRIKLLEFLHLLSVYDDSIFQVLLQSKHSTRSPKRNITRLLTNNETLKLTVSDLANLSGRSISTFTRDFKSIYHMAPKQWLQDKRLTRGYALLINTDSSVTQVALELGYENISHFIQSFKTKYNITPKQLKQRK